LFEFVLIENHLDLHNNIKFSRLCKNAFDDLMMKRQTHLIFLFVLKFFILKSKITEINKAIFIEINKQVHVVQLSVSRLIKISLFYFQDVLDHFLIQKKSNTFSILGSIFQHI
jgi:hypothetical protein